MDFPSQTIIEFPSAARTLSSQSASVPTGRDEPGVARSRPGDTLTISCSDCCMRGTSACGDCLVTFICDRSPDSAVVIDAAEARAVRLLSRSGLLPELRHRARAG